MYYKIDKVKNLQRIVLPKVQNNNLKCDEDYANKFVDELNKPYKHYDSTKLTIKNSVSAILSEFQQDKEFKKDEFLTKPLYENTLLESTELGIAYHSAMQYYEINIPDDLFLDRVKSNLTQTQWEALDVNKIINAKNKINEMICDKAVKIYKEQKFMMYIPYNKVFVDSQNTDEILVQGIVDLMIEFNDKIILIDYKTNKTRNANKLKDTYYMQLNLYKMAAEISFKKEVVPCLYSFSMDEFIYFN